MSRTICTLGAFSLLGRSVRAADAGSAAAADATNSRLDLQVHAFGDSVDCLVARVHDAIAEAARDYETVNQLRRALRRLEPGKLTPSSQPPVRNGPPSVFSSGPLTPHVKQSP
jgi:hypothetical protein